MKIEQLNHLWQTIILLDVMVNGNCAHTETSEKAVADAMEIITGLRRTAETTDPVREIRVSELLGDMLKVDPALYEKILDTTGFAYSFNELTKLAMKAPTNVTTAVAFFKWVSEETFLHSFHHKYYFKGKSETLYTVEELFDRWEKKYNHG